MDGRPYRGVDVAPLPLHQLIGPHQGGRRATPALIPLLLFVLLLLLAAALRMAVLRHDARLHPDEALYATYARRMALFGDFLLADSPLDKPPLGIMATAAAFAAWGEGEFQARVPGAAFSLIGLCAAYGLIRRLYGLRAALIAAVILALSPFDLALSATAFHDPALTMFCLLCALALARGSPAWAGVFAACALATKQSAVQFLPMYVALGWVANGGLAWRDVVRFAVPIAAGAGLLAVWSMLRAAPVDYWTLGVLNPGLLRLIRPDEVAPRLAAWAGSYAYAVGGWPLFALMLIPVGRALRRTDWAALADLIAAGGLLGTLLLYWLVAFNVYDRYLHPLIPLTALLIGRGAALIGGRRAFSLTVIGVLILILILMLPGTAEVVQNRHSIGVQSAAYTGIDQLAASLNALPGESVLYDHWLSWEIRYYLGQFTRVWVVWLPTPESLARTACSVPRPAYFAGPPQGMDRWITTLQEAGIRAELAAQTPLRLYRLTCPP